MRFDKGNKDRTRSHILEKASRRFRKDGIAASGIATIMADAGLTNGAFYVHFESKEALVRAVLESALAQQHDRLDMGTDGTRDVETVVRDYLNHAHVIEPGVGCPSAALLPEIGRQPLPTRKEYEAGLLKYISALASHLPDPESPAAARRAMAIFGIMVGTLQLARGISDRALSDGILEGGIDAALRLAKLPF